MADHSRPALKPALAVLGTLTALGLMGPFLANDKPLLVSDEAGRLSFPAAAGFPVVEALFGGAGEDSARSAEPPPAGSWVLWPPVRYSYRGVALQEALLSPSSRHLMGTDALGRDILARVLNGASISLLVGFGATLVSLALGGLLGGAAGLRGGLSDLFLGRIIEVLGCFPPFLLAMALVAVSGGAGLPAVTLAIGIGRTAGAARFVRGEVLRFRGGVAWSAARSTGSSLPGILLRHILPLIAPPLLVQTVFGMAQAILLESGLSFLGVGLQPPIPSWGMVLAEGRATLEAAWWPILFPSLALALTLGSLAWAAERGTTERHP
ncbi:MAG TPA: ABC transporter permease [Candidatus Cryosericum sp.]|nr:ABC transporter permease [Candidatus Cryosericum sp.]